MMKTTTEQTHEALHAEMMKIVHHGRDANAFRMMLHLKSFLAIALRPGQPSLHEDTYEDLMDCLDECAIHTGQLKIDEQETRATMYNLRDEFDAHLRASRLAA